MLFCKVHVQTRASNNFAILPLFHYCWSWSIRWTILVLLRALTGPVLFSLTCASYLFAALVCVNISACCSRCCTSAYIAIVLCRCPLVILRRDWSEIHLGWLERVSSLPDISCFFFLDLSRERLVRSWCFFNFLADLLIRALCADEMLLTAANSDFPDCCWCYVLF